MATNKILTIPNVLSPAQYNIFSQLRRYNVLVTGRRWGKSDFAKEVMTIWAANNPNQNIWFVASTYGQVKTIIWQRLLYKCTRTPYKHLVQSINKQDLSVTLKNNTIMTLKGADNYGSLRGAGLISAILDEYAEMRPEVWEQIIAPMLSDKVGSVIFIGTPRGYDHLYRIHQQAKQELEHYRFNPLLSDWNTWIEPSIAGGWISPEEIENAKKILDPKVFSQEYMATFENFSGTIYYNFKEQNNVVHNLPDPLSGTHPHNNHNTILVGMDFNVDPMTAVIATKRRMNQHSTINNEDQLHIHDDILLRNSNTHEMCVQIKKRWGWKPETLELVNKGVLPESIAPDRFKIIVFPDPSGNFRKSSATIGITDHVILQSHGFKVISPIKAPYRVDRYNNVNALLENANHEHRLLIHPRATNLIETFKGLPYKQDSNEPDTKTGLDHMGDALGYLVIDQFPLSLTNTGIMTKMRT